MGRNLIFILLLFTSCNNNDDDMKLFINSLRVEVDKELNIILAGQSNAVSRNSNLDNQPIDLPIDGAIPNARYWLGSSFYKYALEMNAQGDNDGGYGIEYRIAKSILDANKAKRLYLLKYAEGGTRIGEDGAWNITDGYLTEQLINEATNSGKIYDYFIWIQGENDSTTESLANAYEANLTGFINHMDQNIQIKNFVIIRLFDFPSSATPYISICQAAQDSVATALSKQIIIPPVGSTLKPDEIHYDTDGIDGLANKIYNEIQW